MKRINYMNEVYGIVCESVTLSEFDFKGALDKVKGVAKGYKDNVSNIVKSRADAAKYINVHPQMNGSKMDLAKNHARNIAGGIGDMFGRTHFQMAKRYQNSDPAMANQHFKKGIRNAAISGAALYAGHRLIKKLRGGGKKQVAPAAIKKPIKKSDDDED